MDFFWNAFCGQETPDQIEKKKVLALNKQLIAKLSSLAASTSTVAVDLQDGIYDGGVSSAWSSEAKGIAPIDDKQL